MGWRQPGDKSLSEPMMVRLPTHICVTRPQWVNVTAGNNTKCLWPRFHQSILKGFCCQILQNSVNIIWYFYNLPLTKLHTHIQGYIEWVFSRKLSKKYPIFLLSTNVMELAHSLSSADWEMPANIIRLTTNPLLCKEKGARYIIKTLKAFDHFCINTIKGFVMWYKKSAKENGYVNM